MNEASEVEFYLVLNLRPRDEIWCRHGWVGVDQRSYKYYPLLHPNITDSSPIYPKCAGGAQCQCQGSESWSLLRVNWQGVGIIWVRRKMIKRWNMPKKFKVMICKTPKAPDIKLSCTPAGPSGVRKNIHQSQTAANISCGFLKYKLDAQGDLSCPCRGQSPFNPLTADVNDNDRLKLLSHRPRLCITVSVLPKLLSLHCLEVFREDLLY